MSTRLCVGDGLVKGIFGGMLLFSNTIKMKLVSRVFMVKKKKCKIDGVFSTI
jgi:hypothetical protein